MCAAIIQDRAVMAAETAGHRASVSLPQSHDTDGSRQSSGVETMATGFPCSGHWVLLVCYVFTASK